MTDRGRGSWRAAAGLCLALTAPVAAAACGGDDGSDALRPRVEEIGPAVDAVESRLGGPQQYFEINATPQVVNVFVATDDATQVETYLYVDGELAAPTPPEGAEGATFGAEALTFDADTILAAVDERLPDSDIVNFSIVGGTGGAVRFGALVESDAGGTLDVTLTPDGTIQGIDTE